MQTMLNQEDNILIQELQTARPEGAIKKLYEENFEKVQRFIMQKGGSEADGADIFQEAVIVMVEKIQQGAFRYESTLSTFLTGIARNLWMTEQRARMRRKNRETNYSAEQDMITEIATHRHTHTMLDEILKQMEDVCKRILIGFYYENLSMKELLGYFSFKNEQVLRNRKNICMRRLKEQLGNRKTLFQS